jgi:hypothetical protein
LVKTLVYKFLKYQTYYATVGFRTAAAANPYCAAIRGILNDDQGGPLHPPGLRMAEALGDVRASLQRNLDVQKGGLSMSASRV